MAKILKAAIFICSSIFALCLIGFFLFLMQLPDPSKLAQFLPSQKKSELQNLQKGSELALEKNQEIVDNVNSALDSQAVVAQKDIQEKNSKEKNRQKMEDILFDREAALVDVCSHLSKVSTSEFFNLQFPESIEKVIEKDPKDPFIQAFFAPIKKVLRLPAFQALVAEGEKYKNKESNLLEKAHFYYLAAQAYSEFKNKKEDLNKTTDRSYRLFSLARAVQKKPELLNDPTISDYCNQIQEATDNVGDFDHQHETAEFLSFLSYAGVKPEEVDYDPALQSGLDVKIENNSLQVGLGWITNMMSAKK